MFSKRLLLIINPKAGKCKGTKRITELLQIFQSGGYLCTVALTEKAGDARQLVRDMSKDYDLISCIGGDGTFSEVVSGMVEGGHKQPIGYLPAGSANDYGVSLGLSFDLCAAANDVISGTPKLLDIGYFNGRPFAYVVAFGAFVKASYSTPQDLKNMLGHLAYVFSGIKDLQALRPHHVCLELDGEPLEGEYIYGMISNAISIGGILRFNPDDVSLNDGYLELMLISMPANAWELSQLIQALSTQSYAECSNIIFRRCRRLLIHTDPELPWTLDGEYAQGSDEILIESASNAISVIVPDRAE